MTVFSTKKEAEAFARNRRKGFRILLKEAKSNKRKQFLRESIKTVKVKKIYHKGWKKPIYEVRGR